MRNTIYSAVAGEVGLSILSRAQLRRRRDGTKLDDLRFGILIPLSVGPEVVSTHGVRRRQKNTDNEAGAPISLPSTRRPARRNSPRFPS